MQEKKYVLMLASVTSMIACFNMANIQILKNMGYEVEVACNFTTGTTSPANQINRLKEELRNQKIRFHQVDFSRNVCQLQAHIKAYKQVLNILKQQKKHFEFVHCHTPIGGVIGRCAGYRAGIKVIYTAHGFHFYKGAPIRNWFFYYPIEYSLAKWTDILITINQEDYKIAQTFSAKKVVYLPGVGINLQNAKPVTPVSVKRKELGVGEETWVLLSVGELSKRKNHTVVLQALSKLQNINFKYFICGQGVLEANLVKQIQRYNLEKKVELLGYRTDILDLCRMSNIYIFPSVQEGLPMSLMEAMRCGLPIIASDIRGNNELVDNRKGGYLCKYNNSEEFAQAIKQLINDKEKCKMMGDYNLEKVKLYSIEKVNLKMMEFYQLITRE